jgi:hypothetical protein
VDGLPQDCTRREAARILHENKFYDFCNVFWF